MKSAKKSARKKGLRKTVQPQLWTHRILNSKKISEETRQTLFKLFDIACTDLTTNASTAEELFGQALARMTEQ